MNALEIVEQWLEHLCQKLPHGEKHYLILDSGLTLPASIQILCDVLGSKINLQQLLHDVAAKTYRIAPEHAVCQ